MHDDGDLERLFGDSAERRLLERRRTELGGKPRDTAWTSTAMPGVEPLAEDLPSTGAALRIALRATPRERVFPGVGITVVAEVHNDGGRPARAVVFRAERPLATALRPEIAQIDGALVEPGVLKTLGDGETPLGDLAPATSVTLRWGLVVEPGADPLYISAGARGDGVPVIGSPSIVISRTGSRAVRDRTVERPFYETDERDIAAFAEEVVLPPPPLAESVVAELVADPPALALPEPEPEPVPEPAALTAPAAEVVEIAIAPEPEAAAPPHDDVELYGLVREPDLAPIERLIGNAKLGAFPHYALVTALACARTTTLDDAAGLLGFVDEQSARLRRLLVARQTGRLDAKLFDEPATALPRLGELPEPGPRDAPFGSHGAVLVRRMNALDITRLAQALGETGGRFGAYRLATLLLLADGAPHDPGGAIAEALLRYRTLAMAKINALFVRMRLDRRTDPFGTGDPALDDAARALIAALRTAAQ